MCMIQECVLYVLGALAKDAIQCPVSNEWLSKELLLEMQSVGLNLFASHTQ